MVGWARRSRSSAASLRARMWSTASASATNLAAVDLCCGELGCHCDGQ